jgi:hypothetical protein
MQFVDLIHHIPKIELNAYRNKNANHIMYSVVHDILTSKLPTKVTLNYTPINPYLLIFYTAD